MKRAIRLVIHLVFVLMALAFGGALYQRITSVRDFARLHPPGELVDIGGRRLHLVCDGADAPTVILDASGLATFHDWDNVLPALVQSGRICSYDRAGMGFSDPGPLPRDARHLADDLAALIRAAKLPPPYVLAGHSGGALAVRLFAAEHPDQVKGLVLVDPAPPELYAELPELYARLKSKLGWARVAVRLGLMRLFNPLHLDDEERALTYRAEPIDAAYAMVDAFPADVKQLEHASTPEVPAIVLSHGRSGDWAAPAAIPGRSADAAESAWQAAMVRLAGGYKDGRVVIVPESGHRIPDEAPKAVITALRQMINRARP